MNQPTTPTTLTRLKRRAGTAVWALLVALAFSAAVRFCQLAYHVVWAGDSNPSPSAGEPADVPQFIRLTKSRTASAATDDYIWEEFTLQNTLPRRVLVRDLRSSCACNDATVSRRELEPRASAVLKMKVRLAGKTGLLRVVCMVDVEGGPPWECLLEVMVTS